MALKIHLQRNTAEGAAKYGKKAACGTNPYVPGAKRNQRSTYNSIPDSKIINHIEYRNTPSAQRCSHCDIAFMTILNRQRAGSGLGPKQPHEIFLK